MKRAVDSFLRFCREKGQQSKIKKHKIRKQEKQKRQVLSLKQFTVIQTTRSYTLAFTVRSFNFISDRDWRANEKKCKYEFKNNCSTTTIIMKKKNCRNSTSKWRVRLVDQ